MLGPRREQGMGGPANLPPPPTSSGMGHPYGPMTLECAVVSSLPALLRSSWRQKWEG